MGQNKGVVGTKCGEVNILDLFLASSEMTRLICKEGQIGLFFCPAGKIKQKGCTEKWSLQNY